ncbi:hypothetical protein EPN52_14895 [bacterium]|nr:MAG: hypothetical protein EPN52_14895 [bacterium]
MVTAGNKPPTVDASGKGAQSLERESFSAKFGDRTEAGDVNGNILDNGPGIEAELRSLSWALYPTSFFLTLYFARIILPTLEQRACDVLTCRRFHDGTDIGKVTHGPGDGPHVRRATLAYAEHTRMGRESFELGAIAAILALNRRPFDCGTKGRLAVNKANRRRRGVLLSRRKIFVWRFAWLGECVGERNRLEPRIENVGELLHTYIA